MAMQYLIEMSPSFSNPVIRDAKKIKTNSREDTFGIQMGGGAILGTTKFNFQLYASSIGKTFPELGAFNL